MLIGLIGVNGSGKTTRLKELNREDPGAFLPDYPNIPLEISAFELLWRVGKIRGVPNPKTRAEKLCLSLLIDGAFDRRISSYSAGNYKKTAIAALLLERKEKFYLDEPFETVDAISQELIFSVLQDMSRAGSQIYLSTQDISLSLRLDNIAVFSRLNVVAEGKPSDVLGDSPLLRFLELSGASLEPRGLSWLS